MRRPRKDTNPVVLELKAFVYSAAEAMKAEDATRRTSRRRVLKHEMSRAEKLIASHRAKRAAAIAEGVTE